MTVPVTLTCHCGAVELEVHLTDGLNTAIRCDCSFCRRRGAVMAAAPLDGVKVVRGADTLTLYQWGTGTAEHYFCSVCGIYTHHKRRSNPDQIGVNIACLDGHTPFLPEVIVNDGVNHPTDTGRSQVVGRLLFHPEGDTP